MRMNYRDGEWTQENRQKNSPKDPTPVITPPCDHITELEELSIQQKISPVSLTQL